MQPTFRVQFAFIVLVNLWLVYYRVFKIKGADRILNRSKGRHTVRCRSLADVLWRLEASGHLLHSVTVNPFSSPSIVLYVHSCYPT